MKKCIEANCHTESKPTEVVSGVQVYECANGHRWGIVAGADEATVRRQIQEEAAFWLKEVA